jgi:hypothetical protein
MKNLHMLGDHNEYCSGDEADCPEQQAIEAFHLRWGQQEEGNPMTTQCGIEGCFKPRGMRQASLQTFCADHDREYAAERQAIARILDGNR